MKARWEHAKEEIMEGMFAAAAAAYVLSSSLRMSEF